jgi:uncharacterized protein (DUF4415 family)
MSIQELISIGCRGGRYPTQMNEVLRQEMKSRLKRR